MEVSSWFLGDIGHIYIYQTVSVALITCRNMALLTPPTKTNFDTKHHVQISKGAFFHLAPFVSNEGSFYGR